MHVVLVYDIVGNRERQRFHKRLKRLLVPVQKSVFEGRLGARELGRVETLVHRETDLDTDAIRLYSLCRSCRGLVRSWGIGPSPPDPDEPVIL